MANGRFLSKTIATDPQLARLSLEAEMLYLKSIPHLDRDGIITGEPHALLGIISPMRFSQLQATASAAIEEWVAVGLVIRYPTPAGLALWFKGFAKQQRIHYHRESPSQYSAPPGCVRTDTGIVYATAVPWTASESGFLAKNPDSTPQNRDSRAQQQQQQQQEQQQEQQQQQQQQQPVGNAAAAAAAPPPPDPVCAPLSPEQELALECLLVAAPDFYAPDQFVRDNSPKRVAHWARYVDRETGRDEIRNPSGFIRRSVEAGQSAPRAGPFEAWWRSTLANRELELDPNL